MIDIHTHIIGEKFKTQKSFEEICPLLKFYEDNKINKIVVTPHYYDEYCSMKLFDVIRQIEKLNEFIKLRNINVDLFCGQEVICTKNVLYDLEKQYAGTINNSRYMLFKIPMRKYNKAEIEYILYELNIKGIIPVIAHPERYIYIINKPVIINDFIDKGCLFQMDSKSILGIYGPDIKKTADRFIKNRIYNFIGSNIYPDDKEIYSINKCTNIFKKYSEDYIQLLNESSDKLINDEEIKFNGSRLEKRWIFK